MARELPHSKLIASAAREVLRPLGLQREGRSRSWLDDRGWWLGLVAFEPSASRGSYLGVGAMWLWSDESFAHYDVGGRVSDVGFVAYDNDDQFAPEAPRLAEVAAARIADLHAAFPTLSAVAEYLFARDNGVGASRFNAAVAAALIGRNAHAAGMFRELEADVLARHDAYFPGGEDFLRRTREYADALTSPEGQARFRDEMRERVAASRAALKLAPTTDLPW